MSIFYSGSEEARKQLKDGIRIDERLGVLGSTLGGLY